jgi:hypothetical protein
MSLFEDSSQACYPHGARNTELRKQFHEICVGVKIKFAFSLFDLEPG